MNDLNCISLCIFDIFPQRGTGPTFFNETENKGEQDQDKTKSLVPLVSILRGECDETLRNFPDFQYFVTSPGRRLLKI
jgi:hypothetical protein